MESVHTITVNDELKFRLIKLGLIPLYTVLASLTWILHDYFVTLEDEVKYMWTQKRGFGKFMFFWIRYYTIFLVAFDTAQIHGFAIPGILTREMCIIADPLTRIVGAISLWSIEIIMQLRVFVLYGRSKKVAVFNGLLFIISIAFFLWILIVNAMRRRAIIHNISQLPPTGCPAINGGIQWAQWIPAMIFELVLFGFAAYKTIVSEAAKTKLNERASLVAILLHENIVYFSIVGCLLIFNNLMVVGATRIPWFGFGPFHAAMGIVTGRMLIHLRRFSVKNLEGNMETSTSASLPELQFVGSPGPIQIIQPKPTRFVPRNDPTSTIIDGLSASGSRFRISEDVESIAGSSTHSEDIQVIPR